MILTRDGKEITAIYKQDGAEIEEVKDANGRIIYLASREITGTLPLSFYALGKPLTDYRISGETIQNGTTSPDMPVDVVGCGEKTENLWDPSSTELERIFEIEPSTSYVVAKYHRLGPNNGRAYIAIYDGDMNLQNSTLAHIYGSIELTGNANTRYAKVSLSSIPASVTDPWKYIYFGKGHVGPGYSAPLPFIPYGYKLPLTVNGTDTVTTPVYIGAEPLHRIGEYADEIGSDGTLTRRNGIVDILADTSKISYAGNYLIGAPNEYACFLVFQSFGAKNGASNCFFTQNAYFNALRGPATVTFAYDGLNRIYFSVPPHIDTVEKCIQWLTDIYESTGKRPVFVCPINTPTTEQVTVPALPTLSGTNSMSVDTTVKPSQMYINGKIKPDGYGKLVDKNGVYILDKAGVQLTVHGQGQ